MELTPLISSFIILLREGFEAMLIAMLVFMYLDKVKARHKRPAVFWGMGAGVLVSFYTPTSQMDMGMEHGHGGGWTWTWI